MDKSYKVAISILLLGLFVAAYGWELPFWSKPPPPPPKTISDYFNRHQIIDGFINLFHTAKDKATVTKDKATEIKEKVTEVAEKKAADVKDKITEITDKTVETMEPNIHAMFDAVQQQTNEWLDKIKRLVSGVESSVLESITSAGVSPSKDKQMKFVLQSTKEDEKSGLRLTYINSNGLEQLDVSGIELEGKKVDDLKLLNEMRRDLHLSALPAIPPQTKIYHHTIPRPHILISGVRQENGVSMHYHNFDGEEHLDIIPLEGQDKVPTIDRKKAINKFRQEFGLPIHPYDLQSVPVEPQKALKSDSTGTKEKGKNEHKGNLFAEAIGNIFAEATEGNETKEVNPKEAALKQLIVALVDSVNHRHVDQILKYLTEDTKIQYKDTEFSGKQILDQLEQHKNLKLSFNVEKDAIAVSGDTVKAHVSGSSDVSVLYAGEVELKTKEREGGNYVIERLTIK